MPTLESLEKKLGDVHIPGPHVTSFNELDTATTRNIIRCAQMRLIAINAGYSITPEIRARFVELGFSDHPKPHNDFREWLLRQPKGKDNE